MLHGDVRGDVDEERDATHPALITWRGRPNTSIGGSPEVGRLATPASETPDPLSGASSHICLNQLTTAILTTSEGRGHLRTKMEADYLLARLARKDPRASVSAL